MAIGMGGSLRAMEGDVLVNSVVGEVENAVSGHRIMGTAIMK